MVAKLVVWGRDRQEAIERLRRALREFVVKGIKTSIPFHQKVVEHPVFLEGKYDTGFIDQHLAGGKGDPRPVGEDTREARRVAFMMAAIAAYRRDKERAAMAAAVASGGGTDPWKSFGRRSQMRGGLR
jgi:acetyl-CoA carboxylase, biotin carboxylase subunit